MIDSAEVSQSGKSSKSSARSMRRYKGRDKSLYLANLVTLLERYQYKCACCGRYIALVPRGRPEAMEIDHIKPRNGRRVSHYCVARYAVAEPEEYQLLCNPCNRYKNNGPFCPCQHWDKVSPGWRSDARGEASAVTREEGNR
jgi:hypothetical protein